MRPTARRLPDLPRQGNTWSGVQDSDGAWLDDDTVSLEQFSAV